MTVEWGSQHLSAVKSHTRTTHKAKVTDTRKKCNKNKQILNSVSLTKGSGRGQRDWEKFPALSLLFLSTHFVPNDENSVERKKLKL